jgi:hypothetical protein
VRIQRDLDLCRSIECSERCGARFPHDRVFALQLLGPLKGDYFAVSALRRLLLLEHGSNNLHRVSDDVLIERVADLLVSRRFHYHVRPPSLSCGRSGSAGPQPASTAFPLAERKTPAPATTTRAAVALADPPTFPPDTNASAQAATLRTASDQGAPFCEVCAAKHQQAVA